MADPISIAGEIITIGLVIKKIVHEVKSFKEYGEQLLFRIQHLTPSLQTLSNMQNQRDQLTTAQKQDPQMMAFTNSLSEMLSLVEQVKAFVEDLKGMSNIRKVKEKGHIKRSFERIDRKLAVLENSLLLGILTEVKKDVDKGRQQDSVRIFVKYVKNSSSLSAGSEGSSSKVQIADGIPTIAFTDLEVDTELGEGGFGSVWLANYRHGEQVAVKIFDTGNNQDNRPLLKEIAKMKDAIHCSYIVRLIGLIDEPEVQGIVMDYFEYGSLKSFLPYLDCDCWPRRMRMLCDISSGINHLHSLAPPIVHRDVKLMNMFVDHGFTVKIGDLGLSASGTTITKPRSQLYLMGTYSHMAPEVWDGTATDAKPSRDIYEFGISIYEFITGQNPWPKSIKLNEIGGLVANGKRPDVAVIKSATPPEVVTMMLRCWQGDPQSRPTSQEIQECFSDIYRSQYEKSRKQADRAIRGKIDADADKPSGPQGDSSTCDSGLSSDISESFETKDAEMVEAATAAEGKRVDSSGEDSDLGAQSGGSNDVHDKTEVFTTAGSKGDSHTTDDEADGNIKLADAGTVKDPTAAEGKRVDSSGEDSDLGAQSGGSNDVHDKTEVFTTAGSKGDSHTTDDEADAGTVKDPTAAEGKRVDSSGEDSDLGAQSGGSNDVHDKTEVFTTAGSKGDSHTTDDEADGNIKLADAGTFKDPTAAEGKRVDSSGEDSDLGAQSGGSNDVHDKTEVFTTAGSKGDSHTTDDEAVPQCKALYDYNATDPDELTFKKGDQFKIINDNDGNWWLAKSLVTGKEGYVPSNYIMSANEWYCPIGRKEAEERLIIPGLSKGTFLVRDSEAMSGSFYLSLQDYEAEKGRCIRHYPIQKNAAEQFYITQRISFNTIAELVGHYQQSADGLQCKLTVPCPNRTQEIPRGSLSFDKKLGTGQFGEVWQGTWERKTPVAIKILKTGTKSPDAFLAEADIMKRLRHKNIVQLFATCSREEPIYIVTELMVNGRLLEYLSEGDGRYMKFPTMVNIGAQIAAGMAVLEREEIIHMDLAARNILVGEKNLVKVAGFSLSRPGKIYQASKDRKYPIRWTAPEAALYATFTIKSDVWSFGILLTEIVTSGYLPYPGMNNQKVIDSIGHGYRMPKPKNCPEPLYRIMLDTWNKDPQKRPTFEFLHSVLDDYFVATEPIN